MDNTEIRWKQRFEQFVNALQTIEDVVPDYHQMDELQQDGLIHRFEITFDLAWKVLQDYLKYIGYTEINGPRPSIKQAVKDGIIDAFIWEEVLTARNELTHVYDEEKSREHLNNIVTKFVFAFRSFKETMQKKS
jgi:nucleotidyltransferase substrate binding protein (TIGR01987 family)